MVLNQRISEHWSEEGLGKFLTVDVKEPKILSYIKNSKVYIMIL